MKALILAVTLAASQTVTIIDCCCTFCGNEGGMTVRTAPEPDHGCCGAPEKPACTHLQPSHDVTVEAAAAAPVLVAADLPPLLPSLFPSLPLSLSPSLPFARSHAPPPPLRPVLLI